MVHPQKFDGQYIGGYWAGYRYKEKLGYTAGVHTGVDYNFGSGNTDLGYQTSAICAGKVVAKIANGTVRGFGNGVIIESPVPPGIAGKRMYHRYLHMQSVSVNVGQSVSQGQKIGTVGNTGTTYAHTHLDVWTDRNGLGPHWDYHKDTALSSYEDAYKLIEAHKGWTGEQFMAETINDDVSRQIGFHYLGRNGKDGKAYALGSKQGDIFGKPLTNAQLSTFFLSAESRDWRDNRLNKVYAERDALKAANTNLNTVNTQLTKAVAEKEATIQKQGVAITEQQAVINGQKLEIAELSDANAKLKEQLALCGNSEDTDNLNKLGEILRWLLVRLGLRG